MKKIFGVLLVLIMLAGCDKLPSGEEINYIPIEYKEVDMSGYDDMSSLNHHFKLITPDEYLRIYEEDGSGAFYFGSTSCHYCQEMVKYMEKAAEDSDQTIYYIDVYSASDPLTSVLDEMTEALYPVLVEDSSGEKGIQTPHFLIMINGEYAASKVGGYEGSDEEIVKNYEDMLKLLD